MRFSVSVGITEITCDSYEKLQLDGFARVITGFWSTLMMAALYSVGTPCRSNEQPEFVFVCMPQRRILSHIETFESMVWMSASMAGDMYSENAPDSRDESPGELTAMSANENCFDFLNDHRLDQGKDTGNEPDDGTMSGLVTLLKQFFGSKPNSRRGGAFCDTGMFSAAVERVEVRYLLSATGLEGLNDAHDDHSAFDHEATVLDAQPDSNLWSASGNLTADNDVDKFVIVLSEATTLTVRVEHDGPGEQIAVTVDSPSVESKESKGKQALTLDLQPGRHVITVAGGELTDPDTVSFRLFAFASGDPASTATDDHANEVAPDLPVTAFDHEIGSWKFEGVMEHAFDQDVFRFNVLGTVEASFTSSNAYGSESFLGRQPEITGPLYRFAPGAWYLQVSGPRAIQAEGYSMTLEIDRYSPPQINDPPLAGADDHPDSPDQNPTLVSPVESTDPIILTGRSESTEDIDVFQFEVTEKSRLTAARPVSGTLTLLDEHGNVIALGSEADISTQLSMGTYYVAVSDVGLNVDYAMQFQLASAFVDAVEFAEAPERSFSGTPEFHWNAAEETGEYEIFVGYRGQAEAVYRSRGIDIEFFELSESLEAGEYVAWVRWHGDDVMSRWGRGHDFVVAARPEVTIDNNAVTWTEVEGAKRYVLQINELAEDGTYLREKVVFLDDLSSTEFQLPEDLRGRRLAVWVRAIQDDPMGNVDQTPWSILQTTSPINYLDAVDFRVTGRIGSAYVLLELPLNAISSGTGGGGDFEVYIALDDDRSTILRTTPIDFELGVAGSSALPGRKSAFVELPPEFQLRDAIVWVRAIGEGLQKSRWGHGQHIGPPSQLF